MARFSSPILAVALQLTPQSPSKVVWLHHECQVPGLSSTVLLGHYV